MKAKNIFKTLAALGYGLSVLTQPIQKSAFASIDHETPVLDTKDLETEISHLTSQVRLWNNFWNRFVLGLATGVGTALGATVIAAIILLVLGPVLQAVGIDLDLAGNR